MTECDVKGRMAMPQSLSQTPSNSSFESSRKLNTEFNRSPPSIPLYSQTGLQRAYSTTSWNRIHSGSLRQENISKRKAEYHTFVVANPKVAS